MSNICGFLDTPATGSEAATLETLLTRQQHAGRFTQKYAGSGAGAACTTVPVSAQGATERIGALCVNYEGRPHWAGDTPAEIRTAPSMAMGIARAYAELGAEFLRYLRGAYALAILIPEQRRALLAVDRMGIRPLAYGTTATGIAYASTATTVTRYPGIGGRLSPQAIHDYLYFHMVPSPQTIFLGVRKLPPAHYALYENGMVAVRRHWSPRFDSTTAPETELYGQLRRHLEQAMDRQFDLTAATTTGAFLSGGLDSSTVVGLLAERDPQARAYTIGFDAEGYDEIPYARQSAAHYRSLLREYYVTPNDVAEAIAVIAKGYDEPFGNASAIPSFFCARLAREDGRAILLAGDGGDELFAGNERYVTQQAFARFEAVPAWVQDLLKAALLTNNTLDAVTLIRKARSYVRQAAIPLPDRLNSYNFLRRAPLSDIFEDGFLRQIDPILPDQEQRATFRYPEQADALQRMLFLDWKYTLADNDLRKVNKACDLAGVEVRYPMLDDDLVDFSSIVPAKLLLQDKTLRDFYKKGLRDFLPPHTIAKKKHGFGLPFGVWMAQDPHLQKLSRASLEDFKQRNIIKASYIDGLLNAQRTQHAAYYGVMIWVIMMLEQWLQSHQTEISGV